MTTKTDTPKTTKTPLTDDQRRTCIRVLEDSAVNAQREAERLRNEFLKDHMELPKPGSVWKRHPAFHRKYEPDWLWSFVTVAWDEAHQAAVIQAKVNETTTHTSVVLMAKFLVEYVEVEAKT